MPNLLSVIIPTYKRKESLLLLLKALLVQKEVLPEIIVVDQNPPGFLDGYIPAAANIRHLRLEKPNASDARNKGFIATSGEIILFIDDDLLPEVDFCSKGLKIFHDYPSIGCFSPLVYNAEGKELAVRQAKDKLIRVLDGDPDIFSITDTISAALFFRRSYYRQTGGFDPMLFDFARTAEDQEFFLRMRRRGQVLYYVPSVVVFHDETVPGGCDLRTTQYWITRDKCMRSWAYRYRIHHTVPGRLSVKDILKLSRSGFLNREGLSSGVKIFRQIDLLAKAIRTSGAFLKNKLALYLPPERMDHLHDEGAEPIYVK